MLSHKVSSFFIISVFNSLDNLDMLLGAGFLNTGCNITGIIIIKKKNIGMRSPKAVSAVLFQIFILAYFSIAI